MTLAAWTALAQDPEAQRDTTSNARISKQHELSTAARPATEPANSIKRGRTVYRGAGPQMIKLRNPLQLINPFAPMSAGSGEQNLVPRMPGDLAPGIAVVSVEVPVPRAP